MKTEQFLEEICKTLRKPAGSITVTDTPDTLAEWDSLGHLEIIGTVDTVLKIPTDCPELQNFTSIGQLVDALKAKGALED